RIVLSHARATETLALDARRPSELRQLPEREVLGELHRLSVPLECLATVDPQKASLVECRLFAAMTLEESAIAVATHPELAERQWKAATAWLYRRIQGTAAGEALNETHDSLPEDPAPCPEAEAYFTGLSERLNGHGDHRPHAHHEHASEVARTPEQTVALDEACRDLNPLECIEALIALCEAVGSLHARNLHHGHLCPGNVRVTADGLIRVLGAGTPGLNPRYTAPEDETTARADVFSLGVIVHEFLAGFVPPRRVDQSALIDTQSLPDSDLAAIVCEATGTAPETRYATAMELADDLKAYRSNRAINARGGNSQYSLALLLRRHPTATAVLITALLALVAWLSLSVALKPAPKAVAASLPPSDAPMVSKAQPPAHPEVVAVRMAPRPD
ncbi:MAG: ECF-type sigma factor, partial [Myxococcota bacterium]